MNPTTGDNIHRLLKFDLIARCAILIQTAFTCLLAWLVPTSLTARLIADGASYGRGVLLLLTLVVVAGAVDILINDFLPDRFVLPGIKRRRHVLYHLVAGLYFVQAFAGVGNTINVEDILCLSYVCTGGAAAWYSWTVSLRATHV